MRPRLLFLCEFMPGQFSAGALVVERHLRRLAREGWDVTLTLPPAAIRPIELPPHMELRPLPARRWWWPPARRDHAGSMRLRARLWARAVTRDPHWRRPPDAVLTVLSGYSSLAAAFVAKAWRTPLSVIVHDLSRESDLSPGEARANRAIEHKVLAQAQRVWPVSDEMSAHLAAFAPRGSVRTLPPVPDETAAPVGGWQRRFRAQPVIVHAGSFRGFHIDYLAMVARALEAVGGTLIVIAREKEAGLAALAEKGVSFRHQPTFATNREALEFIAREASALTVMYPLDDETAAQATGFPSRLLEFSHLGLPMLLAASPGNPLNRWAHDQRWPLLLEHNDPARLSRLIAQLADESEWQRLAAQMRTIAATACDPEKIHRQFFAELPRRPFTS